MPIGMSYLSRSGLEGRAKLFDLIVFVSGGSPKIFQKIVRDVVFFFLDGELFNLSAKCSNSDTSYWSIC